MFLLVKRRNGNEWEINAVFDLLWWFMFLWNIGVFSFIRDICAYHPKAHCKRFVVIKNSFLRKLLISSEVYVSDSNRGLYGFQCEVAAEDRNKMSYWGAQAYIAFVTIDALYFLSFILYYEFNFFSWFFTGGVILLQLISVLLVKELVNWNNAPVFDIELSKSSIYLLLFIGCEALVVGGILLFAFSSR